MAQGNGELYRTRKKGILAEILAAHWLVSQDFWVFKPHGAHGPVDLVAVSKTGKTYYFDVKALSRRIDGSQIHRALSPFQKKIGLIVLYVDLETYEVCYTVPMSNDRKKRYPLQERRYVLEP